MKMSTYQIILLAGFLFNFFLVGYILFVNFDFISNDPNYEKFNNLGTPIITFLGLIVIGCGFFMTIQQTKIAQEQTKSAQEQSSIALSEALRIGIEYQFETLLRNLDEDLRIEETISDGQPRATRRTIYKRILEIATEMNNDEDFKEDWAKHEVGVIEEREYYEKRTYFRQLYLLFNYSKKGKLFCEEIFDLFEEIDGTEFIRQHNLYYKRRIKEELLKDYFHFIDFDIHTVGPGFPITFPLWDLENPRDSKLIWGSLSELPFFKQRTELQKKISNLGWQPTTIE
jgi:hypothetical protein